MRIVVAGANGKMGREIRRIIDSDRNLRFIGGLSRMNDAAHEDIYSSPEKIGTQFDVIIDFSTAHAFSEILQWAVSIKKPFLSGTTGISDAQKKEIQVASKKIPVLWSPNTAPGVHMVRKILERLEIPESFDVQVTEYHHKHKKDKPSGTGIMLQDELKKKKIGKRVPPPISIRGGGIFGIHRIELMSAGEVITIQHEALGRNLFAQGAIEAAAWLKNQKPGLYSMDDFLEKRS